MQGNRRRKSEIYFDCKVNCVFSFYLFLWITLMSFLTKAQKTRAFARGFLDRLTLITFKTAASGYRNTLHINQNETGPISVA